MEKQSYSNRQSGSIDLLSSMRYSVVLLLLISFEVLSQPASRQVPKNQAGSDAVSLAIRQDALSEKLVRILAKSRPERLRKLLNTLFDDAIALKTDFAKTNPAPSDLDSL